MEELVADPLFEIANHGTSHAPLSVAGQSAYGIVYGTGSVGEAYDEVMGNQKYLAGHYAVDARFFRSGTAHMDEVSAAMCRKLGLIPMNFTVNLDAGASFPAATVAAQMQLLSAGSVGIGHFNQPESGTAKGIALGLAAALDSGLEFITLSEAGQLLLRRADLGIDCDHSLIHRQGASWATHARLIWKPARTMLLNAARNSMRRSTFSTGLPGSALRSPGRARGNLVLHL